MALLSPGPGPGAGAGRETGDGGSGQLPELAAAGALPQGLVRPGAGAATVSVSAGNSPYKGPAEVQGLGPFAQQQAQQQAPGGLPPAPSLLRGDAATAAAAAASASAAALGLAGGQQEPGAHAGGCEVEGVLGPGSVRLRAFVP